MGNGPGNFLAHALVMIVLNPASTPAADKVEPDLTGMAVIPAGEFLMGSEELEDEKPVHAVNLPAFAIDNFEVTQNNFQRVMKSNPSRFTGDWLPVEKVTWFEARDYCLKVGKRLPTEAEWEKAARAGTVTRYHWGDEMDDEYAWRWENAQRKTHPVGQKRPNAYGLFDMAGNVMEWVSDWYGENYYSESPESSPKGSFTGKHRVLRGGSWKDLADTFRSACRSWDLPVGRFDNFGFRCAVSLNN